MKRIPTTSPTPCSARVAMGTYTYAARNSDRPCGNSATVNGLCHTHQSRLITPASQAAFADLLASMPPRNQS